MLKKILAVTLMPSQFVLASSLTISNLPYAEIEDQQVCFDNISGTLGRCPISSNGGSIDAKYLSPIGVDGDGNELGTALDNNKFYSLNGYTYAISTRQLQSGEWVGILSDPTYGGEYYTSLDCEGELFLSPSSGVFPGLVFAKASWDGSSNIYSYYSIPKQESLTTIRYASSMGDPVWGCENSTGNAEVYRVYTNEPLITGVPNKGSESNPYSLPITLQR